MEKSLSQVECICGIRGGLLTERIRSERGTTTQTSDSLDSEFHETSDGGGDDRDSASVVTSDYIHEPDQPHLRSRCVGERAYGEKKLFLLELVRRYA